jgi:trehalose/maltose hydrolase-like predicted phosphorylase
VTTGRGAADLALDETFEAIVFDWDGTAVPDRRADGAAVRDRIETLSLAGVHVFVVSGTHVENIDGQLKARPRGKGRLHLCCNRGSEVFEVTGEGPVLVFRRTATRAENRALDRAAEGTVKALLARGLGAKVVSERLNRRKIDLIPVQAWADPKKADIALLTDAVTARLAAAGIAGLAEVVTLAADAARSGGLADPRITSDVKHVEIGLTDKSDSARFVASWLALRGITGRLVLIGGDEIGPIGGVAGSDSLLMVDDLARAVVVSVGIEPGGVPDPVVHLGGGPARFVELLDAQLKRRAAHRVPQVDPDPAWVVPLPDEPAKERVAEALGTVGNGFAATRGNREEDGPGTAPLVLVSGLYTVDSHLLPGPNWTGLELSDTGRQLPDRRLLDLRTGTLMRVEGDTAGLRSLRFVSVASPHAMALRAEAIEGVLEPGDPLQPPTGAGDFEQESRGEVRLARTGGADGGIAVATHDRLGTTSGRRVIERLAAWTAHHGSRASFDEAEHWLAEAEAAGFDTLLADHREAWARRWADAEVVIEGDPEAELAARFAVFHLLCVAAETDEAAVGARGLTGDAYAGHVFWDADVFVLPALTAIRPASARAMLEYRVRRLPAARAAAARQGRQGARFPWESAADGTDVTPREVRGLAGEIIPIETGPHEEHIVADVAWAAGSYVDWTGDTTLWSGPGRDLLVDTARYWASRIRIDDQGHGHLFGVEGPDEYHGVVDDNAYTNVMARWNLVRGATLLERTDPRSREARRWRAMAAGLVDGWDPERGLYEQFAGYFDLQPLLMSEVAPPPLAADVVLGAKRVADSQLIKQADVLMLYHLVPNEVLAGSLGSCLAFYEPRTSHGSSLSPAISAGLLARVGEPERALELFRMAVRLDLDDLTGTTAGGLHLATMGGVWRALAHGFLGLRAESPRGRVTLAVDPCLPAAWSALGLTFRFHGQSIGVRADHDRVRVTCEAPVLVRVADGAPRHCQPPGGTFPLRPPRARRRQR